MIRSPFFAGLLVISASVCVAWYLLRTPTPEPEIVPESVAVVERQLETQAPETVIVQEIVRQGVPVVLPIPASLDFCGEEVPLNDPDVRERLEREVYIMAHRYHQVVFYLKRGHRVLDVIDKEIERRGVPSDLRYIAVAESDLMPAIKSPKGARGVWQFMPATAKRYDLRVDNYVDERMHVAKSTRAALEYLADNKARLGSWTMSAAAYNMGESRASRTQKEQRVRNFYKLYMNEETSRYIFRILAAKLILTDPKAYGYDLPTEEIYAKESVRTFRVKNGVHDLVSWSLQMGVTYYDIKRLNPWIINDRLPGGSFEITVPEKIGAKMAMATE